MSYAFRKSAEAVKEAVPLIEYAARLTELRRRGTVLVGLCPLPDHEEKTPSFTVFEDGHFHCFGCDANGDVIDLHAAIRGHTELQAAMVELAGIYGVELPRRSEGWHEGEHRKADYLDAAARVRGNVLKRRLFRVLVLPAVDAIADPAERDIELKRAWAEWDDVLFWPAFASQLAANVPAVIARSAAREAEAGDRS